MFPYKFIVPFLGATAMATAVAQGGGSASPAAATTVVLVHGAFADSASWNGVVPKLQAKGLRVVSVANPLRSLRGDAEYLGQLIDSVPGPATLTAAPSSPTRPPGARTSRRSSTWRRSSLTPVRRRSRWPASSPAARWARRSISR
jgi:hypothetical protein